MKSTRIRRTSLCATAALAVFSLSSAAQAELVSYDFAANVVSADQSELATVGLPASGQITGSFSFDSSAGWYGGSNHHADPSLNLTIDQMSSSTTTATWLAVEYNQGTVKIHQDAYDSSYKQIGARVTLTGQTAEAGKLPSTLSFGGGSGGLLQLFIGGDFTDVDLLASITYLAEAGKGVVSTPELDPASGGSALLLLLGGAALMADRRRRGLFAA